MNLNLGDHVILVSGGAKGIGEAIVRQLALEGAQPVFLDVDAKSGIRLAAEVEGAHFLHVNLHDADAGAAAVRETVNRFGRINGLVNNAGRNDGVGLEKGSPERFLTSLQENCGHYFTLAHHCLPYLKESKGTIVNIASKTAVTGQGGSSGYVAAKGAILALTREWAVELLPYSIRVNAVVPAEVNTPLYENWLQTFPNPEEQKNTIRRRVPLEHRFTEPTEIADTVCFLLSSRSSHTTGQWIFVDGGYTHLDRAITT
jgi:L-fucose dehydrogenase